MKVGLIRPAANVSPNGSQNTIDKQSRLHASNHCPDQEATVRPMLTCGHGQKAHQSGAHALTRNKGTRRGLSATSKNDRLTVFRRICRRVSTMLVRLGEWTGLWEFLGGERREIGGKRSRCHFKWAKNVTGQPTSQVCSLETRTTRGQRKQMAILTR